MVREVDPFAFFAFELDLTVARAVEAFAVARAVGLAVVAILICCIMAVHFCPNSGQSSTDQGKGTSGIVHETQRRHVRHYQPKLIQQHQQAAYLNLARAAMPTTTMHLRQ